MSPRYVLKIYLVKSHKITNNSATTEAREKISTDYILEIFDVCWTKFEKTTKFYLIKLSTGLY
jgi:hypothetical protein